MKKILKFLLFFILFLIIVLIAAPVLFKGKIISVANEQINKNINATASFSDIKLSLFKQFPNLNIGIKDLTIVGVENFEGDTLVSFESFEVAANLISAIKMENVVIKRIILNKPLLNGIILEDGTANWDIAIDTATIEEEQPEDTAATEFNTSITLKEFSINNARIYYTDYESNMSASLENLNFSLNGDMSKDFTALLLETSIEKINFIMGGIRYMKDASFKAHIDIDANIKDQIYKLTENSVSLNELTLNLDGSVEIPKTEEILVDMLYSTSKTSFKSLLSFVPAIYMKDFNELKTDGKLALSGTIKGMVKDEIIPDVNGTLLVENAMFSYPDLPKSAEKINISVSYHVDGKQMDNTTVDVDKFHVELGNNPVDAILNLKTPISDPYINGHLYADLDLETLADVVPLEETTIKGKITSNLDWMGNMSAITEERYTDFKASGQIKISEFLYASPDLPESFWISSTDLNFSPKYIDLAGFNASIGSSDIYLKGKLTNYIPFILKDEKVSGILTFHSKNLNLNELMTSDTSEVEETADEDTSALEVIKVPENIDFRLNSKIDNLVYDDMVITNVFGIIKIVDSRVLLDRLQMNALDGTLKVSGEYNTQDIKSPLVDFELDASNISIPKTFAAFDIIETIAPVASKATGKVSVNTQISSFLQHDMKPVLNTVVGRGNLKSKQIGIEGSSAFTAISDKLNTDAFKNLTLSDIDLDFEIKGSQVFVSPFEAKFGKTSLEIGGNQGFDKQMDYTVNMAIPTSLLGDANKAVDNLYASAASKGINVPKKEQINVNARITGDFTDPKVSMDLKDAAKKSTKEITEEIKEEVEKKAEEVIETKKEDAKAEARKEADKIMRDAEREAAEVRKQAKVAADKVRKEADINAEKLLNEAKNPLAKKAAEPTAKKIRDEGENKAKKIESEADVKANKILEEARKKSDALLR